MRVAKYHRINHNKNVKLARKHRRTSGGIPEDYATCSVRFCIGKVNRNHTYPQGLGQCVRARFPGTDHRASTVIRAHRLARGEDFEKSCNANQLKRIRRIDRWPSTDAQEFRGWVLAPGTLVGAQS